MVSTAFSEFGYGYAAIREAESTLAAAYTAAGAPVLPSLLMEERLGWDAMLTTTVEYALFLQFKRPDYVSRRHPHSQTWSHVGHKHYRFAIDTGGHQHRLLRDLENQIALGAQIGDVLYCAPQFHTQAQFDHAYFAGAVLDQSVLEPPSEFGDDGQIHHHVTDDITGYEQVLSQPRPASKRVIWNQLLELTQERTIARRTQDTELIDLAGFEELLLATTRRRAAARGQDLDAPVTRRIDRLATSLGCGLVLLGSAPGVVT